MPRSRKSPLMVTANLPSGSKTVIPKLAARRQRWSLILGPVVFALLLLTPAPEGMSDAAWATAAVASLMVVWWISEAVPIPATALLPLFLFPFLNILPISAAAAPYANPVIFLFLGGFLIAIALERCGLHRRMALTIIRTVGTRPPNLIAGFMIATAFLSMWVSNTATVLMMLPMALSVITLLEEEDHRVGVWSRRRGDGQNVQEREKQQRQQGSRRDRYSLAYPPDDHQGCHRGRRPRGIAHSFGCRGEQEQRKNHGTQDLSLIHI